MTDQYAFRDGHFVDALNIERYPTHAIDTNANWFDDFGMSTSWPEAVLDLCGCGSPEDVVEAMATYLTRVEARWAEPRVEPVEDQIRQGDNHLPDLLLAYLADNRKLTEHGGSIYGVWLRDEGKRWLELFRSEATDPPKA